jgi:hypothetical protein
MTPAFTEKSTEYERPLRPEDRSVTCLLEFRAVMSQGHAP